MYGSFYLIYWHREFGSFKGQTIICVKVEAPVLAVVEEWAIKNCPKNYLVRSIEKQFCYGKLDSDMFGNTDVVIDYDGSVVHDDPAAYSVKVEG